MILGLDVSTSITGYTLIKEDKIILNGAWDTRKYKDFFDKVKDFYLNNINEINDIKNLNIND